MGWYFHIMEQIFCVYFTGEWVIRFLAFKHKFNGLKDAWFVFDSCLVFLMVMETWVLVIVQSQTGGKSPLGNTAMLRLLRLLRLSRLMRMLRSLLRLSRLMRMLRSPPELMILIKGMMSAMRSVFYVAFCQMAVNTPTIGDTYFRNVAFGMYSLFIYATFLDDLSNLMDDLRNDKWPLVFLALVFICLASMTGMNMLVGVLCEVVASVAETEKQDMQQEVACDKMFGIAKKLDTNFNNKISYQEFQKIVENKDALKALSEVGVNPLGIVEFAELFFFEDDRPVELGFDSFMEMVLDLREDNKATVKDVLDLWRRIKDTTSQDIKGMQSQLTAMQNKIENKFSNLNSHAEKLMVLTQRLKAQQ